MGTEISPSSPHGGTGLGTHGHHGHGAGSPLDFNSPSHPLHPSFHPRVDRTSLTARNTARRSRAQGTRSRAGTNMSAYEGFRSAQDLVFENSTGEVVRKLAKMNKRSRNKMMYGRVTSLSPKGAYCRMCVGEFSRLYLLHSALDYVSVIDPGIAGEPLMVKLCGIHIDEPSGIACINGYIYVADRSHHQILRIDLSENKGEVCVFAGCGEADSRDGAGRSAAFVGPFGIASDRLSMRLFVIDECVRTVDIETAQVITRIGDPAEVGMKNGTGFQAEFVDLKALCVSRNSRYLYLIDSFAVRRVKLTGRAPTVTTVCGQVDFQGFADGDVDECLFFNPTCIAESRTGQIYVSDGPRIRVISGSGPSLSIRTVAGCLNYKTEDAVGDAAGIGFVRDMTISEDSSLVYFIQHDVDTGARAPAMLRVACVQDPLSDLFLKFDLDLKCRNRCATLGVNSIEGLSRLNDRELQTVVAGRPSITQRIRSTLERFGKEFGFMDEIDMKGLSSIVEDEMASAGVKRRSSVSLTPEQVAAHTRNRKGGGGSGRNGAGSGAAGARGSSTSAQRRTSARFLTIHGTNPRRRPSAVVSQRLDVAKRKDDKRRSLPPQSLIGDVETHAGRERSHTNPPHDEFRARDAYNSAVEKSHNSPSSSPNPTTTPTRGPRHERRRGLYNPSPSGHSSRSSTSSQTPPKAPHAPKDDADATSTSMPPAIDLNAEPTRTKGGDKSTTHSRHPSRSLTYRLSHATTPRDDSSVASSLGDADTSPAITDAGGESSAAVTPTAARSRASTLDSNAESPRGHVSMVQPIKPKAHRPRPRRADGRRNAFLGSMGVRSRSPIPNIQTLFPDARPVPSYSQSRPSSPGAHARLRVEAAGSSKPIYPSAPSTPRGSMGTRTGSKRKPLSPLVVRASTPPSTSSNAVSSSQPDAKSRSHSDERGRSPRGSHREDTGEDHEQRTEKDKHRRRQSHRKERRRRGLEKRNNSPDDKELSTQSPRSGAPDTYVSSSLLGDDLSNVNTRSRGVSGVSEVSSAARSDRSDSLTHRDLTGLENLGDGSDSEDDADKPYERGEIEGDVEGYYDPMLMLVAQRDRVFSAPPMPSVRGQRTRDREQRQKVERQKHEVHSDDPDTDNDTTRTRPVAISVSNSSYGSAARRAMENSPSAFNDASDESPSLLAIKSSSAPTQTNPNAIGRRSTLGSDGDLRLDPFAVGSPARPHPKPRARSPRSDEAFSSLLRPISNGDTMKKLFHLPMSTSAKSMSRPSANSMSAAGDLISLKIDTVAEGANESEQVEAFATNNEDRPDLPAMSSALRCEIESYGGSGGGGGRSRVHSEGSQAAEPADGEASPRQMGRHRMRLSSHRRAHSDYMDRPSQPSAEGRIQNGSAENADVDTSFDFDAVHTRERGKSVGSSTSNSDGRSSWSRREGYALRGGTIGRHRPPPTTRTHTSPDLTAVAVPQLGTASLLEELRKSAFSPKTSPNSRKRRSSSSNSNRRQSTTKRLSQLFKKIKDTGRASSPKPSGHRTSISEGIARFSSKINSNSRKSSRHFVGGSQAERSVSRSASSYSTHQTPLLQSQTHDHIHQSPSSSSLTKSHSSRKRLGNLSVAQTEPFRLPPPRVTDSPSISDVMPRSKSPSHDPAWPHEMPPPRLSDAHHRAFDLQSPMPNAGGGRFDFTRSLSADNLDARPPFSHAPAPMNPSELIATTPPPHKASISRPADLSRSSSPAGFTVSPKPGSWPKSGSAPSLLDSSSRIRRSPFNRPKSRPSRDDLQSSQSPPRRHVLRRNGSQRSERRSPSPLLDLAIPANTAIPPVRPASVNSMSPEVRDRHQSAGEAEAPGSAASPSSRQHRRVQSSSSDTGAVPSADHSGLGGRRKGLFSSAQRRRVVHSGTSPLPATADNGGGHHSAKKGSAPLVLSDFASAAVLAGGADCSSALEPRAPVSSKQASKLLFPSFTGPVPVSKQTRPYSAMNAPPLRAPQTADDAKHAARASDSALMQRRAPMYLSDAVASRVLADVDVAAAVVDDAARGEQRESIPEETFASAPVGLSSFSDDELASITAEPSIFGTSDDTSESVRGNSAKVPAGSSRRGSTRSTTSASRTRESLSSPPTLRRGELKSRKLNSSGKYKASPRGGTESDKERRHMRDNSGASASGGADYDSSGGPFPATHAAAIKQLQDEAMCASPSASINGKQIQDSLRLKRAAKRRHGMPARNHTTTATSPPSRQKKSSRIARSVTSVPAGPAVVSGAGVSAGRPISSPSRSAGKSRRAGTRSVGRMRGRKMNNRLDGGFGTVVGGRGTFNPAAAAAADKQRRGDLMSLMDAINSPCDDADFSDDGAESADDDEEAMSLASTADCMRAPSPSDMSTSSHTAWLPQSLSSRSNSKHAGGGKTPSRLRRGMLRRSRTSMDEAAPAQSENSTSASASRRGASGGGGGGLFSSGKRGSLTETAHGSLSQIGGSGGGSGEYRSNSSRSVASAPSGSHSPVDKKRGRQGLFSRRRRQNAHKRTTSDPPARQHKKRSSHSASHSSTSSQSMSSQHSNRSLLANHRSPSLKNSALAFGGEQREREYSASSRGSTTLTPTNATSGGGGGGGNSMDTNNDDSGRSGSGSIFPFSLRKRKPLTPSSAAGAGASGSQSAESSPRVRSPHNRARTRDRVPSTASSSAHQQIVTTPVRVNRRHTRFSSQG